MAAPNTHTCGHAHARPGFPWTGPAERPCRLGTSPTQPTRTRPPGRPTGYRVGSSIEDIELVAQDKYWGPWGGTESGTCLLGVPGPQDTCPEGRGSSPHPTAQGGSTVTLPGSTAMRPGSPGQARRPARVGVTVWLEQGRATGSSRLYTVSALGGSEGRRAT